MPFITKKTNDELKEQFKDVNGFYPTSIGDLFGQAMHETFYLQMESWAVIIDLTFTTGFTSWIEIALTNIVRFIYAQSAFGYYAWGCYEGDRITAGLQKIIDDAQAQISNAVADMRNRIETEVFQPLKNKVESEIMPKLRDAMSRIDSMNADVDKAFAEVNNVRSTIDSFESRIKSMDDKLASFNNQIFRLTSAASAMDSRIKDADAKLNNLRGTIDDLNKRVKTLEGKQGLPSIFNVEGIFKN